MHNDPLIALHRQIRALHRAEYLADDRHDFEATARLIEAQGPLLDRWYEEAPQSDRAAALKLHDAAKILSDDGYPHIDAVWQEMRRVACAITAGALTASDLASLRALLPAAERIDFEIDAALHASLSGVIAWLARPKLV
jgi:hypothetical protein